VISIERPLVGRVIRIGVADKSYKKFPPPHARSQAKEAASWNLLFQAAAGQLYFVRNL
jgi:hypothetical protein